MDRGEEPEIELDDRFEAEFKQPQRPLHSHTPHSNGVAPKGKRGGHAKKPGQLHASSQKQRSHSSSPAAPPPARPASNSSSLNGGVHGRSPGEVDRAQQVDTEAKTGEESAAARKKGGGRERSSLRAADIVASTAVVAPITAEDEAQVRQINAMMRDIKGRGEKLSLEKMRQLLKVSHELTAFIDAEWAVEGEIRTAAWAVMRAAAKAKRAQWRLKARKEKRAMREDDNDEEKAQPTNEGAKPKKKKKLAIGEGDRKDLSFDGWRHLHRAKQQKKKHPGQDADDEDFEQLLNSEAVQLRKKSLRSRKQINYSAQLEESTHSHTSLIPHSYHTPHHIHPLEGVLCSLPGSGSPALPPSFCAALCAVIR